MSTPSTALKNQSDGVKEFVVEAVAVRNYTQCINLVDWNDCEIQFWVRTENRLGCKWLVDMWNVAHLVLADHQSIQWWERRMDESGKKGKMGKGGGPLRRPKRKELKILKSHN
jgi:hypothetical protein